MSSAYTLRHIIEDCVADKSRTTQGRNSRGQAFYEESWEALNSWIESRLRKRQGATVSPLGDFTWEIKSMNGESQCRPIFLIGESFVKDHHIRQKFFYKPSDVSPCEEVNYSKLAIKFSKSLTKDMIYSGVRDIIKKIGDYIDRIYEVEIEFTFGVLRCKERRVRFEFDNSRLMQILPESMIQSMENKNLGYSQSFSGFETNRSDDINGLTVTNSSTSLNNTAPLPSIRPSNARAATAGTSARPQYEAQAYESSGSQAHAKREATVPNLNLKLNFTHKNIDRSIPTPPLSPALKELLETMDEKNFTRQAKIERRVKACDDVANQAFKRCLHNVENHAIDDDYINFQSRLLHMQWQERERSKKDRFRKELSDIQDTLRAQMDEVNDRKDQEEYDRKYGKVHVGLPGQVLKPDPSHEEIQTQKRKMLTALQIQINSTAEEIKRKKQSALNEEGKRLERIKNELEMDRLMSKASHLSSQRDLLEAWERDAHIRNLQKLTQKGSESVRNYMVGTGLVANEDCASGPSARGTFRLNNSTVGFDTRKGK
jgi:hypothetical protein